MAERSLLLGLLLFPSSFVYAVAVYFRGWLFDLGFFKARRIPGVRVISIGNVTSGGTGKTPISVEILSGLNKNGIVAGLVSRGYGRQTRGVREVALGDRPEDVGDEPLLMKSLFPSLPVFVGERRAEAALKLKSHYPVTHIVADDAFQHRWLARDLDVVLIDATAGFWDYFPLPSGLGREGFAALQRASVVLITKANLVDRLRLEEVRRQIIHAGARKVFDCRYSIESLLPVGDRPSVGKKVFLVSAIAKPLSFLKLMEEAGYQAVGSRFFPDHHQYTAQEIQSAVAEAERLGADAVVVTEKDAVKIQNLSVPLDLIQAVRLQVAIDRFQELYDLVVG